MLKHTIHRYDKLAVLLHWLTVPIILSLFGLGIWMSGLEYYDNWYQEAPFIHKSVGLMLFFLTLIRLGWRFFHPPQQIIMAISPLEQKVAYAVHGVLYLLLLALMLSGYLISTAEGQGISLWHWFKIPALPWAVENQEDIAGEIHETLAFSLMGIVALHALAALKHYLAIQKSDS